MLKQLAGNALKGNPLPLTIDPASLLAVLVMMLPLAVFFSAAMLAIGLYSRSAKEANTYLQPLLICAVVPADGECVQVQITGKLGELAFKRGDRRVP